MLLLPRKGTLAITAVLDIALHSKGKPVAAKALASRHRLPPRHLEPVLQALVRTGILRGVRGPRGGYELAREEREITANEILLAAGAIDDADESTFKSSALLTGVVLPAIEQAEKACAATLARITVADLARAAQGSKRSATAE
jgi:Rrf2 family iron-sulfur cluster assembly transcriptional regulator